MSAGSSATVLERDGSVYRVAHRGSGGPRGARAARPSAAPRRSSWATVVRLEPDPGGELHAIVGVEPRRTVLERRVPEGRGVRPIAANVDQVFVVTATRDPDPIPQLIDRLLVVAEANGIAAAVVRQQGGSRSRHRARRPLPPGRVPVYPTSVKTGEGMDTFKVALAGRTSVVTGPSGAGKSSLLNRVQPGLKLRTGEISAKIRRGKQHHGLRGDASRSIGGGYLVDTPGFSEVGLWGIDPPELFPTAFPTSARSWATAATPTAGIAASRAAGSARRWTAARSRRTGTRATWRCWQELEGAAGGVGVKRRER